jgi:hypothetical protein
VILGIGRIKVKRNFENAYWKGVLCKVLLQKKGSSPTNGSSPTVLTDGDPLRDLSAGDPLYWRSSLKPLSLTDPVRDLEDLFYVTVCCYLCDSRWSQQDLTKVLLSSMVWLYVSQSFD